MRIIPHDPNSSRYCRRIAEIEWEDQKVFLGKLHNEGFTKDQMVKQLADERNFRVTKNRLDKQMNKWGFSRHRRPSSRIHLSAGHSSPNNTAAGAVTAVIEQDSSPNPHVVGHTSSAQQHEPQDPVLMSGSIPTMPSPNSGGKYSPTPPSEDAAVAGLATVPETSGGDPMLPRVDSHSGALCLDPYLFSHRMLALSRETEEHPDLDIRPSRKLVAFNKAGALLHSLKAFDMAFEFYFIVLQDQNMVTDVPTSDLVIAVLNCARSASTPNQMQVAHNAAGALLAWRDSTTHAGDHPERPLGDHNSKREDLAPPIVWEYLRYLHRCCRFMGTVLPFDFNSSIIIDRALIDLSIGRDLRFPPLLWTDHSDEPLRRNLLFEHLQSCAVTKQSLVRALLKFQRCLQERANSVKVILARFWDATDRLASLQVARLLSCLLLDHDASSPRPEDDPNRCDQSQDFCCALDEMALMAWPFVVTNDVHQRPRFGPTMTPQRLLTSAEEMEHSLKSGAVGYRLLLKRCLTSALGESFERRSTINPMLADWVFDVATTAAKLNTTSCVSWSELFVGHDSNVGDTLISTVQEVLPRPDPTDVILSSAMARWSMSQTSSARSFQKYSERVKDFSWGRQARSSGAMSLDSRASSGLSIFPQLPFSPSLVSLREILMSSLHEESSEFTGEASDEMSVQHSRTVSTSPIRLDRGLISSPMLISTSSLQARQYAADAAMSPEVVTEDPPL